ncbi:MAG: lactate utilization protein [Peptostreptococcaceae bacterium]
MNKFKKMQYQVVAKDMVTILEDSGYTVFYAEDKEEARAKVLELIPEGVSIAVGGSETLSEMDLIDEFRNEKYKFFDRYAKLPFSEIVEIYRQSLLADYFVSSTNAITRDGELVNIDSSGNRVASLIFGPKKVIVVAGANKVVENLEEALDRLKKIAPLNARRVKHDVPCVHTGVCSECTTNKSVCNSIGIINSGRKEPGRITIIMVAEELGF